MIVLGVGGWLLFVQLPSESMSPEAAAGFLLLFSFVTEGALLLGITGLILLVLGLAVKGRPS
jgi:hypothetical protein